MTRTQMIVALTEIGEAVEASRDDIGFIKSVKAQLALLDTKVSNRLYELERGIE